MTSSDPFEEFLRRQAADYHAPPADVPREAMWAAIQRARAGGEQTDAAPATGPRLVPDDRPAAPLVRPAAPAVPASRPQRWLVIGMAATLLLGVGIGRYTWLSRPEMAARTPAAEETDGGNSYQVAAGQHLAVAEAFLTSYGATPRDSLMDAQLSKWARDLLSNTRLLLDSPAGRDPARRKLLEDLELVLVQMVQRPAGGTAAEEREHIERSMQRTNVLTRLRSARPLDSTTGT
jgi:hypothetical protein